MSAPEDDSGGGCSPSSPLTPPSPPSSSQSWENGGDSVRLTKETLSDGRVSRRSSFLPVWPGGQPHDRHRHTVPPAQVTKQMQRTTLEQR